VGYATELAAITFLLDRGRFAIRCYTESKISGQEWAASYAVTNTQGLAGVKQNQQVGSGSSSLPQIPGRCGRNSNYPRNYQATEGATRAARMIYPHLRFRPSRELRILAAQQLGKEAAMTKLDVWRVAELLIQDNPNLAETLALQRFQEFLNAGELDSAAEWFLVLNAIEERKWLMKPPGNESL
jgi:hypothetical protein